MIKITYKFVIPIKFQARQMCFKRNPWHGPKKFFLGYSSTFFAIFDDFRVFWMETWTTPYNARGSRKSGSFLRQLNGYWTRSTLKNRKYKRKHTKDQTALSFENLKNELCSLSNKHPLSHESYLKILVWSCLGVVNGIWFIFVHTPQQI